MDKALATIRNGHVELATPVDWAEGTPVEVVPVRQKIGMTEAEWPTTSEAVQTLLKHMDEAVPRGEEPIDFKWDWPEWDRYQIEATHKSWGELEKLS